MQIIHWARKVRKVSFESNENWADSYSTIRIKPFEVRSCDPRFESNLLKSGVVIHDSNQTFWSQDSCTKIRIEPFEVRSRDPWFWSNLMKSGFMFHDPNRTFWSQDSWSWFESNTWSRERNPQFSESLRRTTFKKN